MFQAVSELAIDSKLSQLQNKSLKKGERVILYSNRIQGLVGELESAGNDVTDSYKNRALLRERPSSSSATDDSMIDFECDYHKAAARLVVCETPLNDTKYRRKHRACSSDIRWKKRAENMSQV